MLMDLAAVIRSDEYLAQKLKQGDESDLDAKFLLMIDEFIEKFGDLSCAVTGGKNCVLETGRYTGCCWKWRIFQPRPGGAAKVIESTW